MHKNWTNGRAKARFLIGQHDNGNWVVYDKKNLIGGIFADRSSAVHFAVFESCHQDGAVYCLERDEPLPAAPFVQLEWKRSA